MKKNILFITTAIIVVTLLAAFKFADGVLSIGSDLPKGDVKMKEISNEEISMNDAKRKNGLLVMFSCNTCPYVMKNQERTKAVCKFALKNNIGVILINSNEGDRDGGDSFEAMGRYAKDQKYEWYYVVDKNNEIADAFGAKRTPEIFLFDKNLKLVYHGAIDNNPADASNVTRQHTKEAITEMLAGKDVSVNESKSVGCGIKRK
ncbi:MAG TPA: thioredoxin family protein [Chitinophagaceae bacterium]|nr:thioredoxin family protein [Chitinophagaceae bacterium]